MKTANLKNYMAFMNHIYHKGYATTKMVRDYRVNTKTNSSLKKLKVLDDDNKVIITSPPTLEIAKKLIQLNSISNNRLVKNNLQKELVFDQKKYNKVEGKKKSQIFKIRLTEEEKQYLEEISKKENKTMSMYVSEKLGLKNNRNKREDLTKKNENRTDISVFWGLIKITK